jgi:lipopolysaccharide export system protein LptA
MALILLSPQTAFSITEGREVQIRADYMKFDLETGSSTYSGNVSIIQGTIKLTGDNVVITRKNNEIHDIKVDGDPAHYLQDENTDNKIHAISQHMTYTAQTNRLVMTVNASLEQSNQTVTSQRIVYDTQNKVILAGKNDDTEKEGQSGDRVNIILTPKKETPSTGKAGE